MEDTQIIELYFKRDEAALQETNAKYGAYCFRIAKNILENREDSEECVNDTWGQAWKRIPPTVPESLKAFLGKIVRDISLSRYRANQHYTLDILLFFVSILIRRCDYTSIGVSPPLSANDYIGVSLPLNVSDYIRVSPLQV